MPAELYRDLLPLYMVPLNKYMNEDCYLLGCGAVQSSISKNKLTLRQWRWRRFSPDACELSSDYTGSHFRRHSSARMSDPILIQLFLRLDIQSLYLLHFEITYLFQRAVQGLDKIMAALQILYTILYSFPFSPEDGNRSSFQNVVFSIFYNTGRLKKSKIPVVLNVIIICSCDV
jgi:hypothetical protein